MKTQQVSTYICAALVGAFCISACTAKPEAETGPGEAVLEGAVNLASGSVQGQTQDGVLSFKGIPYAAAPTGALRWRAPHPVTTWEGRLEADTFGPVCPQLSRQRLLSDEVLKTQNEDCLNLNVWAPQDASDLPVMVWIHGGSHISGAGSLALYDGASLARQGVVVVTLNYRLGVFGNFAHPLLTQEAEQVGEPTGNFALLDQLQALEWVQTNIAAFGGDPGNVTVFGESAGGSDILYLLSTDKSKGLFHKAIVQSGGGFFLPTRRKEQEALGEVMAATANLEADFSLSDLRGLEVDDILAMNERVPEYRPAPFIDGQVITQSPMEAFNMGREIDVPLLIGSNSDDGSLFSNTKGDYTLLSRFLGQELDTVRSAYGDIENDEVERLRQITGDFAFTAPAEWFASTGSDGAETYLYHFDYVLKKRRRRSKGAKHATELPFIFQTLDAYGIIRRFVEDEDRAFGAEISACWVSFAKSGAPKCEAGGDWAAYTPETDITVVIGDVFVATSEFRDKQIKAVTTAFERRQSAIKGDENE